MVEPWASKLIAKLRCSTSPLLITLNLTHAPTHAPALLELEIQGVVGHLMEVPEIELGSFVRTARALNH